MSTFLLQLAQTAVDHADRLPRTNSGTDVLVAARRLLGAVEVYLADIPRREPLCSNPRHDEKCCAISVLERQHRENCE